MIEPIENATGQSDFLVTCDECGCKGSIDVMGKSPEQTAIAAKQHGWSASKVIGVYWKYLCPKCRNGMPGSGA